MNEEFKKWWDNYVPQVAHYIATNKEIAEDAWNASREATAKEKRFGCFAPTGKSEVRQPIWLSCLWDIKLDCGFSKSKTDCWYWREVK